MPDRDGRRCALRIEQRARSDIDVAGDVDHRIGRNVAQARNVMLE
jgi:hypothetical protein